MWVTEKARTSMPVPAAAEDSRGAVRPVMRQASGPLRISIITTCLNDVRYVGQALRSIHSQNYPHVEHIVIDGGSTDGSVDVIRSYEAKLAYWRSAPDEGHADALWTGFQRASGDVVTWVCSNDMLLPGALSAVAAYFETHPAVRWAVGHGVTIDEQGDVLARIWAVPFSRRSLMFWQTWGTCQPAVFMRRAAMEAVGGIDRTCNVSVDTDLFMRLASQGGPGRIPHFLAALRIHASSQTLRLAREVQAADEAIRRRAGLPNWPRALRRALYWAYHARFRAYQEVMELFHRGEPFPRGSRIVAKLV